MKAFYFALFVSIGFFIDCNNNADSKSFSDSAIKHDSPAIMQDDAGGTFATDTIRDELAQYNLPEEGIRVNLGHGVDSLYGYANGDTLIVEGDILFSKRNELSRGIGSTWSIWNINAGVITIPYEINRNYKDSTYIYQAFDMWLTKLPVQFVRRTPNTRDYVEFTFSNYTRSFIGKHKGRQPIELADWARKGNIAHEIGHALGLYHEQARSDRDMHVRVICNGDVNYRHAFRDDPYAKNIGPYDFYSIMHYSPSACMIIKEAGLPQGIPGQRNYITDGDYTAVKRIYGLQ